MTGHPGVALSSRHRVTTLIVLGLLAGLGPFTIDLYLPAFPAVKDDFTTTDAVVQLTLSATTIGFAIGQLRGRAALRPHRAPPAAAHRDHRARARERRRRDRARPPDAHAHAHRAGLRRGGRHGRGDGDGARPVRRLAADDGALAARARDRHRADRSAGGRLVAGRRPGLARALLGARGLRRGRHRAAAALPARDPAAVRCGRRRATRRSASATARVLTDRVFIGVAVIGASIFGGMFAYISTSSLLLQEVHGFIAGRVRYRLRAVLGRGAHRHPDRGRAANRCGAAVGARGLDGAAHRGRDRHRRARPRRPRHRRARAAARRSSPSPSASRCRACSRSRSRTTARRRAPRRRCWARSTCRSPGS